MSVLILSLLSLTLLFNGPVTPPADTAAAIPTIAKMTAGMQKHEGLLPFYWDEAKGKIWLEIDTLDSEILYIHGLSRGLGSNDIGLDRGQIAGELIVTFKRIGPKVLMIQPNYDFRATGDNEAERLAVEESFATSVVWGFAVGAEEDGKVLVDATDFYLRDAHDVVGRLTASKQGTFKADVSRSAINLDRTKNFPQNTEVDAILTFTGQPAGSFVRQVTPSPKSITVFQHHSFVQLPDDGYQPRSFDPRAGYFVTSHLDYATPISEPIKKRFISRHRLEKANPGAPVSQPIDPIVYYVDRGTPEPVQSALIEGASWWNQAFEAAGFEDAFRVEVLPEGADPMDVRYNVIQWVHRSTRGWSYGNSVSDPRTGEIIKGHVSLGSLRVRQDYLIAEGLLSPYDKSGVVPPEMQEMALARLRQLSAHEVGHTLGLEHNYAASASDRASVMDYPHPFVSVNQTNEIDLTDAYDTGIGVFDNVSIAYGYQDFPDGTDERQALNDIISNSISDGLIHISDVDARATGGAHPTAHLWDNGSDAVGELERVLEVRGRALARFSENAIREGTPLASLENALVPIYLFHRYQVEAASKVLGGLYYTYAVRGDGQKVSEIVAPEKQQEALEALLQTLAPANLALPEQLLTIIPPQPSGFSRDRENFQSHTGLTFDPLSAAESAADMTLTFLLHPERAARLVGYHARDNRYPGVQSVLDRLLDTTWRSSHKSRLHAEVQRTVNHLVLRRLIELAANEEATGQVRAIAMRKAFELREWLKERVDKEKDPAQQAQFVFAVTQIDQFERDPTPFKTSTPVQLPDGSPIGSDGADHSRLGCSWH